jgi:hypothetical protein
MLSNINNFIANLDANKGPAKAERFYVQFAVPQQLSSYLSPYVQSLTFQCKASELPGSALHTTDYRTYGPPKQIPTMRLYNEITFSFYCTNTFWEKPFFEAWIEYINPRNSGWDFRYKDDYVTDINIVQLGQHDDSPIYSMQLIRAFPTVISPLSLDWEGDSYHILDIPFVYEKYEPLVDKIANQMASNITSLNSFIA